MGRRISCQLGWGLYKLTTFGLFIVGMWPADARVFPPPPPSTPIYKEKVLGTWLFVLVSLLCDWRITCLSWLLPWCQKAKDFSPQTFGACPIILSYKRSRIRGHNNVGLTGAQRKDTHYLSLFPLAQPISIYGFQSTEHHQGLEGHYIKTKDGQHVKRNSGWSPCPSRSLTTQTFQDQESGWTFLDDRLLFWNGTSSANFLRAISMTVNRLQ